jgi:hypothetical protein
MPAKAGIHDDRNAPLSCCERARALPATVSVPVDAGFRRHDDLVG